MTEPQGRGALERARAMLASGALAWTVAAAGALLRLAQYASNRSLWADESYLALNILGRPFLGLVEPLAHNQAAPFGFLFLEKLATVVFGTGELALRLVPLLAGLASLALFFWVARRLLRPDLVPLALALFAVSDRLIYYASEVKQYSTDVAVALALLLAALAALEGPLTARRAALLAAAGSAAVWFSHPAIFVLAGAGVALAASAAAGRDWPRLARLVAVGAAWVASFGAFYLVSLDEIAENAKRQRFWGDAFLPMPPVTAEAAAWLRATFLELFANPGGFSPAWLALLLFLAGCAWLLATDWRRGTALLAPIALCLAASGLRMYPFSSRLLLFLVPALILGTVKGVELLATRTRAAGPLLGLALAAALLAGPAAAAARHLASPRVNEEIKPVLAHVRDRRQPGDVVYLYYGAQYPMRYYAPRFGFSEGDYVSGQISRRSPDRYLRDLDALGGNPRVWIVFSHATRKRGLDEEQFFLDHLDRMGRRLDEVRHPGASAYLYDLR